MSSGVALGVRLNRIALKDILVCGTNTEVLSSHNLDHESLATKISEILIKSVAYGGRQRK